jgi:hypothetical protein
MNTPEEKLKQIEETFKNLEVNLLKLNNEYEAKQAEIDSISNIKNSRIQGKNWRGNIKEKKAFGQKILGIFGGDKENTARRLRDAKAKLQHTAYENYSSKADEIRRQYRKFQNMKEQIELEIQRKNEIQAKQDKLNKIENQKSDLITRYTKLGYTYVPEITQNQSSCAGMPPQYYGYMDCDSVPVKVKYTDYFKYITEMKEKPTDGNWKEEQQTITIPAKYEERVIPGTQGNFGYQGYGSYASSETVKVADAREEIVTVWKRDLPAGFPAKVEYNDFLTVIEQLESKPKNVQSRKRKQNRRKSMKARKN